MKLLVANRGEIACRIFETCRIMGIGTVAVYASDDSQSLHVRLADKSVELPGEGINETYLNGTALIEAAKKTGATLIHPGYGFLSENAPFAELVQKNELIWVGAPSEAIRKMGSKVESKILAEKVKVSTLPWKLIENAAKISEKNWKEYAHKIGYPLLVKASGGGGGRGMRLIHKPEELLAGIEGASREAQSAFKDSSVFLERYLTHARHIEVQILADKKGNFFAIGDRECSAQRRHQKIIEEAPAPDISEKLRKNLHQAAIKLCKEIEYEGAGTIEFLVDEKENYYFLEMNTRLQVEHPVTEATANLDLVREQIRIALGEALTIKPNLKPRGHAIECRIYAEDAQNGFVPTPGPVRKLDWPTTRNTRIDTGITEGQQLSHRYDPLVAKLTTWGNSREEARFQMLEALSQTTLLGFTHNISFLKELLQSQDFIDCKLTTGLIEAKLVHQLKPVVDEKILKELVSLLLTGHEQSTPLRHEGTATSVQNLFSTISLS